MKTNSARSAELLLRSFTMAEAALVGISRHQIRYSDLHTPSRGIRVPWGVDQDLPDKIRPLLEVSPNAVASHSTAARLWGMPVPPWLNNDFEIHFTCNSSKKATRRAGIIGHRAKFLDDEVELVDGLRVTSPARTWLDLASMVPIDDLVAAGDYLVCEHQRIFEAPRAAISTLGQLKRTIHLHVGRRGVRNARHALDLIRVGADSVPESKLRLAMYRKGLPEPTLNYVVRDEDGRHVSWPDLCYPEFRLAIEYDGAHHLSARQQDIDERRNALMRQLGWKQIRITVDSMDEEYSRIAVTEILNALRDQGWSGQLNPQD